MDIDTEYLTEKEEVVKRTKRNSEKVNSSEKSNAKAGSDLYDKPSFYHLKILKKYFGHSNFRPMQWQIINSILKDKRDNCGIMSTGYGKSLCYQYPALYSGAITLVISPLISLMEDQVLSLKVANISACLLGTAQKEKSKVLEEIFQKKFSIIYLTPEFATGDYGQGLLDSMKQKLDICLVAIDEAHCISSWGHDFRFQYRQLGKIRNVLPGVPFLAVTATATERVVNDIIGSLRLKNPQVLRSGYDRPNLYLEAHHKNQQSPIYDFNKVLEFDYGKSKLPGPTIVYCLTRKATDKISELLTLKGINCAAYHAGKSLKERKEVHEKFLRDQLDCIVATSAFGMGIDKPDVRCIVHHGTPSSIEAYYQEIGRAGRDGEKSRCILFFSESDFKTHDMISDKHTFSYSSVAKEQKEDMSVKVRKYLYTTECRRSYILSYFGESFKGQNDHCCDICYKNKFKPELEIEGLDNDGLYDFTDDAEIMLKSIQALNGKFGMSVYILFIRGSNSSKLRDNHKNHILHGCGKHKSEDWWKTMSHMLLEENFLVRKPLNMKGFTAYLFDLSDKGERFLNDLEGHRDNVKLKLKPRSDILEQLKPKVQMVVHSYNSDGNIQSSSKPVLVHNVSEPNKEEEINKTLYNAMLEKRYQIADERDCMPHNVISIPDIKELIKVKPRTLKELEKCSLEMFSEIKIHQFGQTFIDIIVDAIGPGDPEHEFSAKTLIEPLLKAPLLEKVSASSEMSYNLLKQGNSIQEISEKRKMVPQTIFNHLLDCMKKGLPIKLEQMEVDEFARLVIMRAILETPVTLLTPIKEKCPPEITWDQIRTVLTYTKIRDHLEENNIQYEDFEDFSYESLKSEAGALNLENITSSNTIVLNKIQNDASNKCKISATSVVSKEDQDLNEFLKICENLINEDELQLSKNSKSNSTEPNELVSVQRGEKRKSFAEDDIGMDSLEHNSCLLVNNVVAQSSGRRDDLISSEIDPISIDENGVCDDFSETEMTNKLSPANQVVQNGSEADVSLDGFESDDDIFKSPPRSELGSDSVVTFKIRKLL